MEDYKVYTVFVSFEAKDEEDAEDFVLVCNQVIG